MNHIIFLNSFSEVVFLIAFIVSIFILLFVYGIEIIKDKNKVINEVGLGVTSKHVTKYFTDNGYLVCNVFQENENIWLGYLIKNDEFIVAKAFINGNRVENHLDSLKQ